MDRIRLEGIRLEGAQREQDPTIIDGRADALHIIGVPEIGDVDPPTHLGIPRYESRPLPILSRLE